MADSLPAALVHTAWLSANGFARISLRAVARPSDWSAGSYNGEPPYYPLSPFSTELDHSSRAENLGLTGGCGGQESVDARRVSCSRMHEIERLFSAPPWSDTSTGSECAKAESSCDQRGRTQVPGLRSPRELLVSSGECFQARVYCHVSRWKLCA